MKITVLLVALALATSAQTTPDKPKESTDAAVKKNDPVLHSSVVKLFEIIDLKQRLQDRLKESMPEAKKQMMGKCERCTSVFADEWEKRMLLRSDIDAYAEAYVKTYEKYFTAEDINDLIALQNVKKGSEAPIPSPRLKEKLTSVMPSVMSETLGGCAQIGAKLGAEIGMEIEKEHPEYIKPPSAQPNKP